MLGYAPFLARRTRRLLVAWLGLFALVAQALLPVVHPVAPSRMQAADASSLDKIVICTPYGFKLVSLDELPGDDTSRKSMPGQFCPLCQAAQTAAALPPPDGPALGRVPTPIVLHLAESDRLPPAAPATGPPQARAPPFFA